MGRLLIVAFYWMLASSAMMYGASRKHTAILGKPANVALFPAGEGAKSEFLKVRPLYVDGNLREFTTAEAHDITDRQFVVQRVFRINDSLPGDPRTLPKWRWQRGTWLLVDRATGRVSTVRLPYFDSFYSRVAWYRDYAAYCGVSESGEKLFAIVAQLGARKPIALSPLRSLTGNEAEPPCHLPLWQRLPTRATFVLEEGKELTLTVHGNAANGTPAEPLPSVEESEP
jgi:hypothetical protein